jgi:hypothetical protein
MSERQLPRVADPAPRSALLARAAARPQPGLATAVVCALALAVGGVHSMLVPAAEGTAAAANAGSGRAVQHAPAAVIKSVATRRCRHRRATSRRAARAVARCAPVSA